MNTLWQDLSYALRTLVKKPGFAAVAVITLALGVGANTAIFNVINGVLLEPLPFPHADRLAMLWSSNEQSPADKFEVSYPNFADLREQCQSCQHAAAYFATRTFLMGGDEPERVVGVYATADLFEVLGVAPAAGRVFTRAEDRQGSPRVAVLSHDLWQRSFSGSPQVIGQQIKLGSISATVLGVMPPGFNFPVVNTQIDVWMPLVSALPANTINARDSVFLNVVARLKPGASVAQAQSEVKAISERISAQYPDSGAGWRVVLTPLHEEVVGGVRRALLVLLVAVGCVLLIACANVANLLLARAAGRQREIAIRTALGASRWRIVRQVLTESLVLALLGGGAGMLMAVWGGELLLALSPRALPRLKEINFDWRVLLFTLLVSIITGLLFGLAPACRAAKANLNEALKEGGKGASQGPGDDRLRRLLVIAEVAISIVLLAGAGLLIRSFQRLQAVDPGFNPRQLLTAEVSLLSARYEGEEQMRQYFQQAIERLRGLPGVNDVAAVNPLPFGDSFIAYTFQIEGRPPARPGEDSAADHRIVSPDYFRAMQLPLRRGRSFAERDTKDAPLVAIVNESFVRSFFAGEDPIGKRIVIGNGEPRAREIIGVVGDVRHLGLDAAAGAGVRHHLSEGRLGLLPNRAHPHHQRSRVHIERRRGRSASGGDQRGDGAAVLPQ